VSVPGPATYPGAGLYPGGSSTTILATQYVPHGGKQPSYASAAAGGNSCATGWGMALHIRNGDSAPHTATIAVPLRVDALTVTGRTVTVTAGGMSFVPMLPLYRDPATGLAAITYDGVTSVTVAVLRVDM
jgi:hypothetical protein